MSDDIQHMIEVLRTGKVPAQRFAGGGLARQLAKRALKSIKPANAERALMREGVEEEFSRHPSISKAPGGNWIHKDMGASSPNIYTQLLTQQPSPNDLNSATAAWAERTLRKYLERDFASENDPLRDLANEGVTHLGPEAKAIAEAHVERGNPLEHYASRQRGRHAHSRGFAVDERGNDEMDRLKGSGLTPMGQWWNLIADALRGNSPYAAPNQDQYMNEEEIQRWLQDRSANYAYGGKVTA